MTLVLELMLEQLLLLTWLLGVAVGIWVHWLLISRVCVPGVLGASSLKALQHVPESVAHLN